MKFMLAWGAPEIRPIHPAIHSSTCAAVFLGDSVDLYEVQWWELVLAQGLAAQGEQILSK